MNITKSGKGYSITIPGVGVEEFKNADDAIARVNELAAIAEAEKSKPLQVHVNDAGALVVRAGDRTVSSYPLITQHGAGMDLLIAHWPEIVKVYEAGKASGKMIADWRNAPKKPKAVKA